MGPSDLLCASCGGRVAQARCATCRFALADLRARSQAAVRWLLVSLLALAALLAVSLRAAYA